MMCQCALGFLLPFLDLLLYLFCSNCDLVTFSTYSLNSALCCSVGNCVASIGIVAKALHALRTWKMPCRASVVHNVFICGL